MQYVVVLEGRKLIPSLSLLKTPQGGAPPPPLLSVCVRGRKGLLASLAFWAFLASLAFVAFQERS